MKKIRLFVKILFIFVPQLLVYCAAIEPNFQCFVPGQCSQSQHLDSAQATNERECLSICQGLQECNWFTFFPSLSLCESLADCVVLDVDGCPDCLSGERGCDSEPVCWVTGECQGTSISTPQASDTQEACLELCKAIPECKWFTFVQDLSVCYFFGDCPTLDESCSTCVSGESTCESQPPEPSGEVILLVGGSDINSVEVYSPGGQCQYNLSSVPTGMNEFFKPVVVYLQDTIIACGGNYQNQKCWSYDPLMDSWTEFTQMFHSHDYMPGLIYQEKLFIVDTTDPEVYDPNTHAWTLWREPPTDYGWGPCMLLWQDAFYVIGGNGYVNGVQKFEHLTNIWRELATESPFDMWFVGCAVLPNDKFLVTNPSYNSVYKSAALFDPQTLEWTPLPDLQYARRGGSLIEVAGRYFLIGGEEGGDIVEEFDYLTNTWTTVEARLLQPRLGHGLVKVPAKLFENLPNGCVGIE